MRTSTVVRPAWIGKPKPIALAIKALAIALILAIILFPLLIMVSTSFASQAQIDQSGGFVLWPTEPSWEAYRQILQGGVVTRAVLVSIGVTLVGTFISLSTTVLAAYGLSKKGSLLQRPLLTLILLTFLFSPGMIPMYLMVKQMNLLDSYWALIIPGAVSAFNLVIVRGFFMSIPQELIDAARIDGASEWRILRQIMLPLSKAVIAVVGLFYGVGYWNAFFGALLYLSDSAMWPLQLILRTYVLQASPLLADAIDASVAAPPAQSIQMAVVVIAVIPIMCVYPFLQKHLTKGVLTGAVKG